MTRLMEKPALFTPVQIEAAMRNMCKPSELAALEKTPDAYEDLVDFMGAFFEEWAHHFPAFLPDKSADERNKLRSESFALSNVMFHPLFKLAYDLWKNH